MVETTPTPTLGQNDDAEAAAVETRDARSPDKDRARRRVLWLVLVHAALLSSLPLLPGNGGSLFGITVCGLVFAQAGLLSTWMALGSSNFVLKLCTMVSYSVLQTATLTIAFDDFYPIFLFVSVGICLAVFLFWCVARAARIALHWFPKASIDPPGRFQFRIWTLLVVTTMIALVLGMKNLLLEFNVTVADREFIAVFSSSFVFAALASVWATLGIGHVWRRSILAIFLSAATGFALSVGSDNEWFFPAVPALQATIMMASLWVVRSNGYRLLRAGGTGRVASGAIQSESSFGH